MCSRLEVFEAELMEKMGKLQRSKMSRVQVSKVSQLSYLPLLATAVTQCSRGAGLHCCSAGCVRLLEKDGGYAAQPGYGPPGHLHVRRRLLLHLLGQRLQAALLRGRLKRAS